MAEPLGLDPQGEQLYETPANPNSLVGTVVQGPNGQRGTLQLDESGMLAFVPDTVGTAGISDAGQLAQILQAGGGPTTIQGSEAAQTILRQLALGLVPSRRAAIEESFLQNARLAQGAPQEILQSFNEQINQIQAQLQQASQTVARQGGRAMGGQRQRAQGALLGQGARAYQDLYGQGVLQGQKGLFGLAANIRPLTSVQIPAGTEKISSSPFDFATAATGISTISQQLERILKQPPPSQNISPALQNQQWQQNFGQLTNTAYAAPPTLNYGTFAAPSTPYQQGFGMQASPYTPANTFAFDYAG